MAKIDIDTLSFILQRNEPDIKRVQSIMQDIQAELKAEEEEKANRPPAVKKQFAIILSDPLEQISHLDITGWVVQIPEDDSVSTAPEKIIQSAYEYNASPKGRRMPVQTIGEACEVVPAKITKEKKIWVKTKVPVPAVTTFNQIPTEPNE